MIGELTLFSVWVLFRHPGKQVTHIVDRGLARSGILPGLAAKIPLLAKPRSRGSLKNSTGLN